NTAVFQNGNTSITEYAANAITLHNTFNLTNANANIGAGNLNGEGDITLAGTVNVSGTNTLGVSAGLVNLVAAGQPTGFTISGIIQGTGSLTKAGVGTMTLSGANTFAGGTIVTAGSLIAANSTVLSGNSIVSGPFGTGVLTLNTGSTVQDDGNAR